MQKCTHCEKAIPSVHVLDVQGGRIVRTQALCETCAESLGVVQPKATAIHLSNEILENLLGGLKSGKSATVGETESSKRAPGDAACPACGLTRQEFKARGRLGCARCYEVFRPHLVRLFERVHDATRHTGRFPGRPDRSAPPPDNLAGLKDRLRAAIHDERYEEAARIRDEMRRAEESRGPEGPPSS